MEIYGQFIVRTLVQILETILSFYRDINIEHISSLFDGEGSDREKNVAGEKMKSKKSLPPPKEGYIGEKTIFFTPVLYTV